MALVLVFFLLFTSVKLFLYVCCTYIDPNGYVLYCPCMGRFGNQADHFLGSLGFAHGLNRTLALPPWVEYKIGHPRSIQVPFNTYFQVEPLNNYTKVITMESFISDIAPTIWPIGQRKIFCYGARGEGNSCNAKEGNPFGPFWDTFDVDFDDSVFYKPLNYDIYHHDMAEKWNKLYSPEQYPVLAFTGAPATFPVQEENRNLHQYLFWNAEIIKKAKDFIRNFLPLGPFVGIHLRNGIDWTRACEHVEQSPLLFSAPQCLGYRNEQGHATYDMCFPSKDTILRQLKRVVKAVKARAVFVASDKDYMISEIDRYLKDFKVKGFKLEESDPHLDLAILGLSNHFIGNCISSFSAFAKRERDSNNLVSSFWAFPPKKNPNSAGHDEF